MILHELFFASLGDESAPEGELRGNRIEAIDRATVIILVMANNQLLGHSLDPRRITG